jgi:cbb3-type cytochrome oxidase maturation protein
MTSLAWLVPLALLLGAVGLAAFMWALRSGQFEDLEGAAYRALDDEPPEDEDQAFIDAVSDPLDES